MDNIVKEKILDILSELNADDYEEDRSWNGYKVYIPVYDEVVTVGLPYVILVKGDEVRLSTDKEAMEFLNFETNAH